MPHVDAIAQCNLMPCDSAILGVSNMYDSKVYDTNVYSSEISFLQLPLRPNSSLNIRAQPPGLGLLTQRINTDRKLLFPRLLHVLVLIRELLRARPTTLYAARPAAIRHMFEFVREAVLVDALFHNLYFVADKDCGKRFFDNGPEDGHRGADDGEVDFETGEHDHGWRPPCEVDIRVRRSFGLDDAMQAPD
jgi:hypothetical protein